MEKAKKFLEKNSIPIILILIFLSMLMLNYLTPLIADDLTYRYIFWTNERVKNISDIIVSQTSHYFKWGGRSVAHSLAQLFLMFPKGLFDLLNAFCYTAVVYLVYDLATDKKKSPMILLLIHFLIYFIVPAFGEDFLWLTGSCNYSWTILIMLTFLDIYKRNSKKDNTIKMILMFLFGVLAGWTNENTAFGLIVITTLFLFNEKMHKTKIKKWKLSGLLGSITGFIILIAAPGNYARKATINDQTFFVIKYLRRFINCTSGIIENLWPLLLLLLVLYTYCAYKKKKVEPKSYIYLVGAILSVYAMVMSPEFPPRAWLGIVIFMIIAIINLLANMINDSKLYQYILLDVLILLTCFFVRDYYRLAIELKHYDNIIEYRKEYIKEHIDETDTFTFESYKICHKKSPMPDRDLNEDKEHWSNRALANYYGVKYLIGY